jgi:N-methylhydantoinase A
MASAGLVIGIDVGGTFTDAVVLDAQHRLVSAFKIPSTPADPAGAVGHAIAVIAEKLSVEAAVVCHGTTVGTNALIERKGAPTALLATRGFTDVIELRRQARPVLYAADIRISPPLVPPALRFGVDERLAADGSVVTPLCGLDQAIAQLQSSGVEAVAISFLNSYANAAHELAVEQALRARLPHVFVSRSSDVCPEFREYERTSTTVVNGYIGPVVHRYLTRLAADLRSRGVERLMVVKSNGGLTSPGNAARYPVHLIESGPAAALIATAAYARATARPNLIAFDMGGTTAKAGVVRDGEPAVLSEFYADRLVDGREVGGYAIRSAVLDIVEVGAGGGSIGWIDEAGVLKVGPQSAGAVPGPACYGRGGELPTVTDAHAVIGTLTAEGLAQSGVAFDRARAVEAIRRHIAEPLGWPVVRAAYAIVDIAVANMAQMVRLATVQRGLDPRDFAILASGGAGPLHAAAVGAEIGAREVIVPPYPGMFSAIGATLGSVRHEVTATLLRPLQDVSVAELQQRFAHLRSRADELLAVEPAGVARPAPERIIEARFVGQMFELRVPLGADGDPIPAIEEIETQFRAHYRAEYGFDLPQGRVQVVNLRLIARVELGYGGDRLFGRDASAGRACTPARAATLLMRDGEQRAVPVFEPADGRSGSIAGPAIVALAGATVWIHADQTATLAADGCVSIALTPRAT